MKLIQLTQGKFAKVDDEDFEYLNQFKWCFSVGGYAQRRDNGKLVYMHRVVAHYSITDHKDMDKLNNQKENLREATNSENMMNRNKLSNNTSGYKGVSYVKNKGDRVRRWRAKFRGRNTYHLTAEEAARAYDEMVKEVSREFAVLNFP